MTARLRMWRDKDGQSVLLYGLLSAKKNNNINAHGVRICVFAARHHERMLLYKSVATSVWEAYRSVAPAASRLSRIIRRHLRDECINSNDYRK